MIQVKWDKHIAGCALAIYDTWQENPSFTMHVHMTKRLFTSFIQKKWNDMCLLAKTISSENYTYITYIILYSQ